MFRSVGIAILLVLMLAAVGCQPVMPEVVPEAVSGVATEVIPEPTATDPVVTGPLHVLSIGGLELEANWGVDAHLAGMAAAADPPIEITVDHVFVDGGTMQGYT